ncbi:MAG: PBP1A family penicillin-binding protein [Pseudomonadota bacterium]
MYNAIGWFFRKSQSERKNEQNPAYLGEYGYPDTQPQADLPKFLSDKGLSKTGMGSFFGRGKARIERSKFYPHQPLTGHMGSGHDGMTEHHDYNRYSRTSANHSSSQYQRPGTGAPFQQHYTGDIVQARTLYAKVFLFCIYWGTISAIWMVLALIGTVALYSYLAPDPLQAGLSKKAANIVIMAQGGKVIAEKGLRRNHIPLNEMPKHMIDAVLATEDRRFYYHFGFDPIGITRAIIVNRRAGRIIQGGSTITQQLAKVLFLKPKKTYWRKVEEMLLALWLEYRLDKDQILELYLNRIYFGGGNYGIEAATQHYFGKTIAQVTIYEAALLAGLIKSPSYYAPTRNYTRSVARGKVVLQNMKNGWFISSVQYDQALQNPPKLRSYLPSKSYGYVIDYVMELVADYGQDLQTDMIVETTIDYELQGAAQKIVKENMDLQAKKYNAGQVAAVIVDKNGEIKAMVGGRDYKKNQFNRVVKSRRQPGSTFKPFVFLAAMERGMTPDSQVYDGPIRIGTWTPKNYNDRYYGNVSLRASLSRSLNTVSVRLAEWVGRDRVIKTAHRLGISTKLKNNPSIALGTSEVSLLEITSAYAPFANGGYAVRPHVIQKISDQQGQVLYKNATKNWGRVIRPQYVAAMNDMLTATIMVGTAKKASLDPHQVAGKTGTGQSYRDAWFIGYSAHYVTGVWLGNDNFKPMKRVTGGSLPTLIWKDLMKYSHANKSPIPLPGGRWEHAKNWQSDNYRREEYEDYEYENSDSFFGRLFGMDRRRRRAYSRDDTTLGYPPSADPDFVGSLPPREQRRSYPEGIDEDPFQPN